MRVFVVVVGAALGAVAWGSIAGSRLAPPRALARTVDVGPEWSASLPRDPGAATDAYLRRVSPETRARGDAFDTSRRLVLGMRIAVLLGSIPLIMFTGAATRMRHLARRVSASVWLQDGLSALQLYGALFLLNLPVETYAGFIRLRYAGFSQRTYADWLSDAVVGWAVITPFNIVGAVVILALIRRRPQAWAAWATAVYGALSVAFVLLSPQFIEPLLNHLTPMSEGPQKRAILSLARANGVPAEDVFVQDASRQSALLNAHVSGLGGAARIVLDDNTIAQTPDAEVRLVMAHEIGHYVLAHVPKGNVFDTLQMGVGFLVVAWSARRLVAVFGRRWGVVSLGDVGALPVLWGLVLLWGIVSMPVTNGIAREQESEADLFGINASQEPLGLAEFMIRDADAARLDPPAVQEWLFYDHPSARNRILAAMRWRAEHLPVE